MKRLLIFSSIPTLSVLLVTGNLYSQTGGAPGAGQTPPAPAAEPVKEAPVRVEELGKKVKKENDEAIKRIEAIDKTVDPVMAEEAVRLYGIKPDEFKFLRMQADSQQTASFLSKQRRSDSSTVDGMADYFDEAYRALQAGEFWYGREETLVSKDAELFDTMKADVMAAIAKRPDGAKILDMISEKDRLVAKLKSNKPLYSYLSERREWWKFYPDYKKAVEEDYKHRLEQVGPQK